MLKYANKIAVQELVKQAAGELPNTAGASNLGAYLSANSPIKKALVSYQAPKPPAKAQSGPRFDDKVYYSRGQMRRWGKAQGASNVNDRYHQFATWMGSMGRGKEATRDMYAKVLANGGYIPTRSAAAQAAAQAPAPAAEQTPSADAFNPALTATQVDSSVVNPMAGSFTLGGGHIDAGRNPFAAPSAVSGMDSNAGYTSTLSTTIGDMYPILGNPVTGTLGGLFAR